MAQSSLFPDRGVLPDLGANTTLAAIAEEAAGCTRCHLYRNATQTVFGEGPEDARVLLVGEQPGDQEDTKGHPFVGPAGQLLDRALQAAGIDRRETYVTNAVKHFKFEPRGKRRIHKKPDRPEIDACRWWLEREVALLAPEVVVAMGSTAGLAVTGRRVAIMKERGTLIDHPDGFRVLVTVHPSALLRIPDRTAKAAAFDQFVADLRLAA
jgi:uracil-DNA glycosylase family protein